MKVCQHSRAARLVVAAELFVDTSAWYPLILKKHPEHARMSALLRKRIKAGDRPVLTNLVRAETHALLTVRGHLAPALEFARTVALAPNLVIWSDQDLEAIALSEWLAVYDDQDFSLTDAVSFAVMKSRRIERALTLDHHFATAGFEVL